MDIRSHTNLNHREMEQTRHQAPVKAGLWKLLVAAVLILLGLIAAIEIFGDAGTELVAPNPPGTVTAE
ncbi:hypothetical protein [Neorhizobium alkalisoli]|uniref:hypothetical protein n=1 Tax=Neorhizobium alkalisoli TaxID=528178 RepID=UPI000CF9A0F8|nr:hypothetical protein [Neorhizobium alkalisoli]